MADLKPALTLHQPWAWAIVRGFKRVENRAWRTNYRGRLLIHAGKTYDPDAHQWMVESGVELGGDTAVREATVLGAFVGEVTLHEIVRDSDDPWAVPGMFHWLLTDAVPYRQPRPARGKQGLWWPR